jgi:predicted ATPase
MQSKLIVKNFGPLKDIDVELKNVNVFIGPQASGKSALAKLFTIFKAPRRFLKEYSKDSEFGGNDIYFEAFKDTLEEYNIASFLKDDSEIEFESELHQLSYRVGIIKYVPKLLKKVEHLEVLSLNLLKNEEGILEEINRLRKKYISLNLDLYFNTLKLTKVEEFNTYNKRGVKFISINELAEFIAKLKSIEVDLSTNTSLYIPSERNFINIIMKSTLNLIKNNVPIPEHILSFGAELEKTDVAEIDLTFLNKKLFYKNINGEERIFTDDIHSIKLIEASSGIQTVIPILKPILHRKNNSEHRSFVIEEPELNLFPVTQYELIKQLEMGRSESYWEDYGTIHTYTTHSPYILSALNNLLYAYKVEISFNSEDEDEQKILKSKILKIVSANINPRYFTAYQIFNGKAQSIFNEETGLIDDNFIDEASDKIGDDFDALMQLMSEYKHAVK